MRHCFMHTTQLERQGAALACNQGNGDIPSDEEIAKLTAPVLFIGASKDNWITVDKMEGLRESLEQHGKEGEVKIYEGADHAFFNDTRPEVHDPKAAADAWRRVIAFFEEKL